jgi:hypothetical protein
MPVFIASQNRNAACITQSSLHKIPVHLVKKNLDLYISISGRRALEQILFMIF